MRPLIATALCSLLLVPGCGGGGDSAPAQPGPTGPAAALDSALKTGLVKVMPMAANAQSTLVFVLNPGSALSQGVSLTPDNSPGAAPNAFTLSGTYDGNGDGLKETTLSGSVVFASPPASGWSSASGRITMEVSIPVVGHIYQGTLDFTLDSSQLTLSGSGSFNNPLTGATTSITVPGGAPLVFKPATGNASALANACGYSIAGAAQMQVAATAGTLRTTVSFSHDSLSMALHTTSFVDANGQSSTLPDSTADLNCGGSNGTLNDWVGQYEVSWACLPQETDAFRTTIAVSGPNALALTDEGSSASYAAALVGPSPHAVRGFFDDGPPSSYYREFFNWTLRKDGNFSQFSNYVWQNGPQQGSGGICAATGRRL